MQTAPATAARRITWKRGRFSAFRVFSDGQLVGVLAYHPRRGYVAVNGRFGQWRLLDAVGRLVGRYGLDEAGYFERTVMPRGVADVTTEDDMATGRFRLPTQLAGKLRPLTINMDGIDVLGRIKADQLISHSELLILAATKAWDARDPVELYTDGGLVGQNGSAEAGTWAWCGVDKAGNLAAVQSGLFRAKQILLRHVSNNVAECAAAIRAILAMPADWGGALFTDSEVTKRRLEVGPQHHDDVPHIMRAWHGTASDRVRRNHIEIVLVKGHASQAHLDAGRHPGGLPTTPFNSLADRLCSARSQEYRAKKAGLVPAVSRS